jgi:4a-hydroxytetrahydrobiopterin dehydratase
MPALLEKKCSNLPAGTPALDLHAARALAQETPGWEISPDHSLLYRAFSFKDFYHSMEFANAVALIANAENHHPDLEVAYKKCVVKFSTHTVKGLSENDFICAAKINKLLEMTGMQA